MNTRFKKGHIPFNKGKKWEEFMTPEGMEKSRATRFKKGHKPCQTRYDGALTLRKINEHRYLYIRLAEKQWEPLHRHVWERRHGAIPAGSKIVFRDGNPANCDIANLECVTNAELLERNRMSSSWPVELRTAIKTRNKIIKKIKENGKKQN